MIDSTTEVYAPRPDGDAHRRGERGRVYRISDTGIFAVEPTGDLWLCSPLDVIALTRSEAGEEWGMLIKFPDLDGNEHMCSIAMETLGGALNECCARLLHMGLRINPARTAKEHFGRYILTREVEARARCVSRLGWHGREFVLPDETVGALNSKQVIFQSTRDLGHHFAVSGTLDEWKQHVGALCCGNSRLLFAVSTGFAAPLVGLADIDGGGFHFRGPSSSGKTTLLNAAGSPCGGGGRIGYVQSWKATGNALEVVAEFHNDNLLCLDELAQVDANDAAEIGYLLVNGRGKLRMTRTSSVHKPLSWRLLFLSSGEIGLSDHVASAGRRVRGGQQVRMVDIESDAGAGFGVFEDLHGEPGADAFARKISLAARTYYGTPLRAFLSYVVLDLDGVVARVNAARDRFLAEHVPAGASGEVSRVAGLFSVVATAGELATELTILPWSAGEATGAAAALFKGWLQGRAGAGATDTETAINQVRAYLEAHGASRFQSVNEEQLILHHRAGFKQKIDEHGNPHPDGDTVYFVLPEAFRTDVCAGHDA